MGLCECGCGQMAKIGNKVIWHHKSKEIRAKLSAALMGHSFSDEAMRKMKGRKCSKEQRLRISEMTKLAMQRLEVKRNQHNATIGKKRGPFSEEHKRKIGIANSKALKGRHVAEDVKLKISKTLKGRKFTSEQIAKLYSSSRIKNILSATRKRPTSYEQQVIDIIKSYNLDFKYVGDGQKIIGTKNPDFINDKNKKIIEVHGRYWDSKSKNRNRYKNTTYKKARKEYFSKFGYETLVLCDDTKFDKSQWANKILKFNYE